MKVREDTGHLIREVGNGRTALRTGYEHFHIEMERRTARVKLERTSSSDGTREPELGTLETDVAKCWWAAASAGDLGEAWRQSDRLTHLGNPRVDLPRFFRPLWNGTPVDNRPVLVRCWRGLGDAIHYARYLPFLARRAKSVCLEAPQQLIPIFGGLQLDQIIPLDTPLKLSPDTIEIESTELPYVFRTTLETIPQKVPYLNIPFPSSRLVPPEKPSIGLCWAGGGFDLRRAVPLESLSPLATVPGLNWFHLQPDYRTLGGFRFVNSGGKFADLLALAALIRQLDLIITIDTMVAHLAGALARPVWTFLHSDADWRWFRDRPDSPWYPTMRLFRQMRPGVWDDPIEELVLELASRYSTI